jgi:hypothetical protein
MADSAPDNKPAAAETTTPPAEQDSIEAKSSVHGPMDMDIDIEKETKIDANEPDPVSGTASASAGAERDLKSEAGVSDTKVEAGTGTSASADADANTNEDADVDMDADADADVDAEADAEADADADADVDVDAEGEPEGEPEDRPTPNRLDNDMLTVIENVANYLTTYKDSDGYYIASHFQRIPNRRLIPDYHDVIKEPTAFSTIRVSQARPYYAYGHSTDSYANTQTDQEIKKTVHCLFRIRQRRRPHQPQRPSV